jgi:hypothetical protein
LITTLNNHRGEKHDILTTLRPILILLFHLYKWSSGWFCSPKFSTKAMHLYALYKIS